LFDTELDRVVSRLRSMQINKLDTVAPTVHLLARQLLEVSRDLGDAAPVDQPAFQAHASGDVIMVLGRDVRARAGSDGQLEPATAALTQARRALP